MTITITVPDQIAAQAATLGLSVEAFVEQLAKQATSAKPDEEAARLHRRTVAEAVDHMRSSRKGVKLGGLKIKDLVHEGHRS